MTFLHRETPGMSTEWASGVRNVCQAAVGDLLAGGATGIRQAATRLVRELAPPSNDAEAAHVRQTLLLFLNDASVVADRRFHAMFDTPACPTSPPRQREQDWLGSGGELAGVVERWALAYEAWFQATHDIPIALRAREWLDSNPSARIDSRQLAHIVGGSKTALEAEFQRSFGTSVAEYARRLRIIAGMRRLRTPTETIEDTARAVGYQSANKFYSRLFEYSGLRPSEVRRMSEESFRLLTAGQSQQPVLSRQTRRIGPAS
jgi:AraC-like DNA-binding protein